MQGFSEVWEIIGMTPKPAAAFFGDERMKGFVATLLKAAIAGVFLQQSLRF